jgi:hypothetical protein
VKTALEGTRQYFDSLVDILCLNVQSGGLLGLKAERQTFASSCNLVLLRDRHGWGQTLFRD